MGVLHWSIDFSFNSQLNNKMQKQTSLCCVMELWTAHIAEISTYLNFTFLTNWFKMI